MENVFPEIKKHYPQRLMIVSISNEMLGNRSAYFVNLYFPVHHMSDPKGERTKERSECLEIMETVAKKLAKKLSIWVGDFNAMRHNQTLAPNMKITDPRCELYNKMNAVFQKHNFSNMSEIMWVDDVFTRHGICKCLVNSAPVTKMVTSRLDYIIISEKFLQFHHRNEPVYDEAIFYLSDHSNISCLIKKPSSEYPSADVATKITCAVPDLRVNRNVICPYPNCGQTTRTPAAMIRHVRIHTGEKPFVCERDCGFRSAYKAAIEIHARVCKGSFESRMLQCPDCPATTPILEQFQIHRKSCTQNKQNFDQTARFKCTKCLYSTNKMSGWKNHEASVKHNADQILVWYFCLPCNYVTLHTNQISRHCEAGQHKEMLKKDNDQ